MDDATDHGGETLSPLAYGGPSTAGLFELRAATQYLFRTTGNCKLGRASRIRTILNNLTAGSRLEISGADAGEGLETRHVLSTSGSLLLSPGIYSWITEINPNPSDAIDEVSLKTSIANSPEAIESRGLREAFSLISSNPGRNVYAQGSITAQIGDNEFLSAQVVVTDLSTNQRFASPVLEMIGPTAVPVTTGVVPYVIAGNHVFLAKVSITYAGQGLVTCTLRHRWDHE